METKDGPSYGTATDLKKSMGGRGAIPTSFPTEVWEKPNPKPQGV